MVSSLSWKAFLVAAVLVVNEFVFIYFKAPRVTGRYLFIYFSRNLKLLA